MLHKTFLLKRSATLALLVFGVLLGAAWAQKESVLYSFCAQTNCTDGDGPQAGVVFDQRGNLYGTTVNGGAYGRGVVFKLTPKGKETVLYSFCADINCTDGYGPSGGLVLDQKGNLYGTAQYGGAFGAGLVFKITPEGKETVLYSFCAQGPPCTDGVDPWAGLAFGQEGSLYGTTFRGGIHFDCGGYACGVVFKLTPKGKETVLYSFCAQYKNGKCTDGANPLGLVVDNKGNLYGTTASGGAYNGCNTSGLGCGVAFKLTPKHKEMVLYSFCAHGGDRCTDGENLNPGLVFDQKGNLYGTTAIGGSYDAGAAFKLTPKGKETVLYSFCAQAYCFDGYLPEAGLILDQKGNLYGTTFFGGNLEWSSGVVFSLSPRGNETVLYTFCAQNNCTDGALPLAGVIFDQKRNLYGTTWAGGAYGDGVVFKITP